jgi:diaminopimelate decarboxylase
MELFEQDEFKYIDGELYCEKVPVKKIMDEVSTPVYIYSKKGLTDRFNEFESALEGTRHTIFYACKSNFNINIIRILAGAGMGVDVNSAGELFRALKANVEPSKIIMSGVGKSAGEIKEAVLSGIKLIKAESIQELRLINSIARELGKTAEVAVRINPDVDPKTHPYISTGLAENKFGIAASDAEMVFKGAAELKNIKLTGIDMHIGSQITAIEPYADAVNIMAELYKKLKSRGTPLDHFDIGGGMGVRYNKEKVFKPSDLFKVVKEKTKDLDCEIMCEPGRYITANSGILAASVLYTKKNNGKNFIIVDAAMSDLLRPSIYGAYHHIQPVEQKGNSDIVADIVGPVCESGDFLAKNRKIEECGSGSKLAVMSAGAYGMVMASNYNGRRRPPEVLVDGLNYKLIRSRETFEHMLWDEETV